jgi:hypothetical protein
VQVEEPGEHQSIGRDVHFLDLDDEIALDPEQARPRPTDWVNEKSL